MPEEQWWYYAKEIDSNSAIHPSNPLILNAGTDDEITVTGNIYTAVNTYSQWIDKKTTGNGKETLVVLPVALATPSSTMIDGTLKSPIQYCCDIPPDY